MHEYRAAHLVLEVLLQSSGEAYELHHISSTMLRILIEKDSHLKICDDNGPNSISTQNLIALSESTKCPCISSIIALLKNRESKKTHISNRQIFK